MQPSVNFLFSVILCRALSLVTSSVHFIDLQFPSTNVPWRGRPGEGHRWQVYTFQPRPSVPVYFPGVAADVKDRPDRNEVPVPSSVLTPPSIAPSVIAAVFVPSENGFPVKIQPATTTTTQKPTTITNSPVRQPESSPPPPQLEDHFQCGFRDVDLVCGLSDSVCIDEFPWLALLVKKSPPAASLKQRNFCTGVLVHPKFVLAAQNCVKDLDFIRFREHNLDNTTDCSPGIIKTCSEPLDIRDWRTVHFHPSIPVALVELTVPVSNEEDFKIYPACLPSEELARTVLNGEKKHVPLRTAGWGTALPHVLNYSPKPGIRQAKVQLVQCGGSDPSVICAQEPLDWLNRCVVDAGAPLFAVSAVDDPEFDLALFSVLGIDTAEVGTRSCSAENPQRLFYYVPSFRDWILKVIKS